MSSEIEKFMTLLWGTTQSGFVTLWRASDKVSNHIELKDRKTIVSAAHAWDTLQINTYYGFGLRRQDFGSFRQGHTSGVCGASGVYIDIDFEEPRAHRATGNLPKNDTEAVKLLEYYPYEPTAIVHTGYGIHAYYLFDQPFLWDEGGHERYGKLIKDFQKFFITKAKNQKLQVDDTATVPRLLRLPGLRNWKIPEEPKPVVLMYDQGPRYTLSQIELSVKRQPGSHLFEIDKVPVVSTPLPKDAPAWLETTREYCLKGKHGKMMALVFKGESFAEPGNRNSLLNTASSVLTFNAFNVYPQVEAPALAEVFRPSLTVWADEPTAKKTLEEEMEIVTGMISGHLVDAARKKEETERVNAEILSTLRRGCQRQTRTSAAPLAEKKKEPEEDPAQVSEEEKTELLHLFVLIGLKNYYILGEAGYEGPYSENQLKTAMRDAFEGVPLIQWYNFDEDGVATKKTLTQLLNDYATVVREVVYDSTISNNYFEDKNKTLFIACASMRELTPVYNPDVDRWLRLLGGKHADKLLDWIATIPLLSKQTCCLYLSGAQGTGKTLLSHGLARLWKERGGPTELAHVVSTFNADLLRCPLVVADEEIPHNLTTGALRDIIGSSAFTISQKYMPNSSLHGAVRVLLLANNDKMLVRDEELTSDDIKAIAKRFLHIETTPESQEYLSDTDTDGWIDDDIIAKHALWLVKNRKVVPGKRFLVEGEETRMHRKLAMQVPTVKMTVEWLVRYLKGKPTGQQLSGLVVGDGKVLVAATALSQGWELFISSRKVPATHQINDALKVISEARRVSVDGPDELWDVKREFLEDHARELWGNAGFLSERMDVPRPQSKMGKVIPMEKKE